MSAPVPASAEAPRTPRSRAATRQAWVERLARFAQAGLSPAQFCATEGVSLPNFYAWKRRLTADGHPGNRTDDETTTPRLLPVRLQPAVPLELVLPGGAVLRLLPGCDLQFVRALLHTLGDTPC
jgi:transposase